MSIASYYEKNAAYVNDYMVVFHLLHRYKMKVHVFQKMLFTFFPNDRFKGLIRITSCLFDR